MCKKYVSNYVMSISKINEKTFNQDPHISDLIGKSLDDRQSPKVVIIGFPSDEGVHRNGGRTGAAQAPDEIRKALYKLTPDARNPQSFSALIKETLDAGNIEVTGDVEKDQQALGEKLGAYLKKGVIPVVLGGGHETAFGHFLGYTKAELNASIFNLDAHADVRPLKDGKAHSGSPFRQAIEHQSGCCQQYNVFGLQPHSVAESHLQFINRHNGNYRFRDETTLSFLDEWLRNQDSRRLMITFDMDSVDQSFAPGVSAPCTNGFSSALFIQAAYLAGKCSRVTSFDLAEANPTYDRDGQTVRLAALTIWSFLAGVSRRE